MAVNPHLCHFSRPMCRGFSQEVHRASCEKFGTRNSIRRRKASGGRVVAGHEKTNSIHQPARGAYPRSGYLHAARSIPTGPAGVFPRIPVWGCFGRFRMGHFMEAPAMKHEYETQSRQRGCAGTLGSGSARPGSTRWKAALDRQGKHVPCPVHGGRDGFRGLPGCRGYGRRHLQHMRQFCRRVCATDVDQRLGLWPCDSRSGRAGRQPADPVAVEQSMARSERESRTTRFAGSISIAPGENRCLCHTRKPNRLSLYLARRGLSLKVPDTLRFHPELGYYADNRLVAHYPALIAQVNRAGRRGGNDPSHLPDA
jgi:hypothetical protein